jgi:phage anti-repressor protein
MLATLKGFLSITGSHLTYIGDNCMTNITLFTLETAQDLYNNVEEFPIDFDMAWVWLGYTRKDSAKKLLTANFIENEDYKIISAFERRLTTTGISVSLRQTEKANLMTTEVINITSNCLKEMGMLAGTVKGKEIRQYFIQCERIAKERYQSKLKAESKVNPEELQYFKDHLKLAKDFGTGKEILRASGQLTSYLSNALGLQEDIKLLNGSTLPFEKKRIFDDLLKACKGVPKTISDLRTHSLMRRKDVLVLYGAKNQDYLRKSEIIKLLSDAAKHSYGTFKEYECLLVPSNKL